MISIDYLLSYKDSTEELAATINAEDIDMLVNLLNEQNDEIRYAAFQTLKNRSKNYSDVYPYWDALADKLTNDNSYQRSIGIMLIAENIKWDTANKFDSLAKSYLTHCDDEKFITARQAIQSISIWLLYKVPLFPLITEVLTEIDVSKRKSSQRKLLLMDILTVLAQIQKIKPDNRILKFMLLALAGGNLDPKSAKLVNKMFSN